MTRLDKRQCGPCRACCVELKIDTPQLRKQARMSCPHLTTSGCGIYAQRPPVCREFLCGWRLFEDMGDDWRPDLSGILAIRKAPSELPAAWAATAPYGVHLAIIGDETAIERPAFADYVRRLMRRGIPVFLSAASPHILLNEHLETDSEPAFFNQRLAELYGLLHTARFGRSLLKRIVFLYRLQIDRHRQRYSSKSTA